MAIKHVNLSEFSTGGDGDTLSSCWGSAEFMYAVSNAEVNYDFKLRGSLDYNSSDVSFYNNLKTFPVKMSFTAEDLTTFGPWRIKTTGNLLAGFGYTKLTSLSGAIIFTDGSNNIFTPTAQGCVVSNSYFSFNNSSNVTAPYIRFKGCTIVGGSNPFINETSTVNDSIIVNTVTNSSATFNNCVFSTPGITSGSPVIRNSQFNWLLATLPVWDAERSSFNSGQMSTGIGAQLPNGDDNKPNPGMGYPSYVGYSKGLWGTSRTGVGAMDFPQPPKVIRIETYDYKTGSIIDTNTTSIEFGDIIQGQHTYKPIVLRFIGTENLTTPVKLFLENKGAWRQAQFGVFTSETFIPNIESGSPYLATHMVEVPDATESSPDGFLVPVVFKNSYYVWLDIDIPVTQDGIAGINYRIIT